MRNGTIMFVTAILLCTGLVCLQDTSNHHPDDQNIELEGTILLSQTFPPESYNFTVSIGANDWDFVLSAGSQGDAIDGVFDVLPGAPLIDFFICDYDNLLEWSAGNTSIERYSVFEDRYFAYWHFIPPTDDLWFYVFVNNEDIDIVVWVREYFDTDPPWVDCNASPYHTYETPVSIHIGFTDWGFNISYYSVYLYDVLLAEVSIEPESSNFWENYYGTFTMEDLEGTSQKLNFTGYTNDTAGNGRSYSFSIRIEEPSPTSPPSSSTTTSPSATTESTSPPIPLYIYVIAGAFVVIICVAIMVGDRVFGRNR